MRSRKRMAQVCGRPSTGRKTFRFQRLIEGRSDLRGLIWESNLHCGNLPHTMPEDFEGDGPDNLDEPPPFFPYDGSLPPRAPGSMGDLIEVQVEGIYATDEDGQISRYVMVSDGTRHLPILIGPFEAQAIQLVLENTRPDRPMTHDLVKSMLDRLSATIDRAVIDDYWNTIYYAKVYLQAEDEETEIDARPSDAIALAIRFDAPIFVADGILDLAQ
jgi:bifunctional DNase/RNase